jgi:hypothetical protein
MIEEVKKQKAEGLISPELADEVVAFIERRMDPDDPLNQGVDWEAVLYSGGGILLSILSAYTGVRITRGPPKPMDSSDADTLKEIIAQFKESRADD